MINENFSREDYDRISSYDILNNGSLVYFIINHLSILKKELIVAHKISTLFNYEYGALTNL